MVMNDANERGGAPLIVMSGGFGNDAAKIKVPTVFIRNVDGEQLRTDVGDVSKLVGAPARTLEGSAPTRRTLTQRGESGSRAVHVTLNATGLLDPTDVHDARSMLGSVFFFLLEVFIGIWAAIGICFAGIWCKKIYDGQARVRAVRGMRRRRFKKSDLDQDETEAGAGAVVGGGAAAAGGVGAEEDDEAKRGATAPKGARCMYACVLCVCVKLGEGWKEHSFSRFFPRPWDAVAKERTANT
jgi:hypothetical protein